MRQLLRKLFLMIFAVLLLCSLLGMYAYYHYLAPPGNNEQTAQRNADAAPEGNRADTAEVPSWRALGEYEEPLLPVLTVVCAPGLFLLGKLGIVPASTPVWVIAGGISWPSWAVSLRLAWIVPARYFGFGYSPQSYRWWQWIGPPWKLVYGPLHPALHWFRLLPIGGQDTDKFAGFWERAFHTFRPGQILLGRQSFWYLPGVQPLGLTTERGATVIASIGSGKTSWLITQLSMYLGNFAVVDADGGILNAIGEKLARRGKQIINLDPLRLVPGFPGMRWNPIAELDRAAERYGAEAVVEFAAVLADGLIKMTPGVNEWVYSDARAFLKSLLLYVYSYAKPEQRNLTYVRQLMMLGEREKARAQDDPFFVLLADMMLKRDFGGAISAGAAMMRRSFSQKEGKSAPLSNAIQQLSWLDLPAMARLCAASDFECLDLKKGNCALFLVLPLQAIQGQMAGWMRTFMTMTTYAFQRDNQHRPRHQTVLALDEAAHLQLEMKTVLGGLRKHGLSVVAVFQSVAQMKAAYPDSWQDYLGLSECNLWMATNDQSTLEYLSNTLGSYTRVERVQGSWLFNIAARNQRENRRIASPGQVKMLLRNHVVVTRADARPMILKPIRHYKELPVRWLTASNFYKETKARAWTRRCQAWLMRMRRTLHSTNSSERS